VSVDDRRHGQQECVEFLARARRLEIDGLPFTMVLLHDIQDQKRREALERTFFHDILNTMGALRTYGELVGASTGTERDELLHEMNSHLHRSRHIGLKRSRRNALKRIASLA
jgi:hypothetical protein